MWFSNQDAPASCRSLRARLCKDGRSSDHRQSSNANQWGAQASVCEPCRPFVFTQQGCSLTVAACGAVSVQEAGPGSAGTLNLECTWLPFSNVEQSVAEGEAAVEKVAKDNALKRMASRSSIHGMKGVLTVTVTRCTDLDVSRIDHSRVPPNEQMLVDR
jgi:hypothetical protein